MIRGYVGLPGAGKTYTMVEDAWKQFRESPRQIYTNMSGLRCPEAIYVDGLDGLLHVSNGLVLFDEIGVSLSSRYWQGVSRDLLMRFAQVRKNGLDLFWTSQHENRVDAVMREITNEYCRCARTGPLVVRATWLPEDKKNCLSRRVNKLNKQVYELYDTLEVIGTHGGSVGRGAAALSTVERRRARGEHDRRKAAAYKERIPHLRWHWWEGGAGPMVSHWSEAAQSAYLGLLQADALTEEVPLYDQVQGELRRRAWLAAWKLSAADAPISCTPAMPWLEGHDPETIQEARKEREREDAAEKLVLLSERPRRKKAEAA